VRISKAGKQTFLSNSISPAGVKHLGVELCAAGNDAYFIHAAVKIC